MTLSVSFVFCSYDFSVHRFLFVWQIQKYYQWSKLHKLGGESVSSVLFQLVLMAFRARWEWPMRVHACQDVRMAGVPMQVPLAASHTQRQQGCRVPAESRASGPTNLLDLWCNEMDFTEELPGECVLVISWTHPPQIWILLPHALLTPWTLILLDLNAGDYFKCSTCPFSMGNKS